MFAPLGKLGCHAWRLQGEWPGGKDSNSHCPPIFEMSPLYSRHSRALKMSQAFSPLWRAAWPGAYLDRATLYFARAHHQWWSLLLFYAGVWMRLVCWWEAVGCWRKLTVLTTISWQRVCNLHPSEGESPNSCFLINFGKPHQNAVHQLFITILDDLVLRWASHQNLVHWLFVRHCYSYCPFSQWCCY